jgi:hypothetical protein
MMLVMQQSTDFDEMDEVQTGTSERRRGLRIRQARPIRVYEPAGSRYFGGQTEDISATGLRIELPISAHVHPGKVISVHVGLNRDGSILPNRRQMMPARVVWVDRSFTCDYAIVGVEFLTNIAAHLDAA